MRNLKDKEGSLKKYVFCKVHIFKCKKRQEESKVYERLKNEST